MNEVVNNFLLVGDKFMLAMHCKIYLQCLPNISYKQRNNKKIQRNNRYKSHLLGKPCFQHNMAYGYFKDLAKRTAADKVLRDELRFGLEAL